MSRRMRVRVVALVVGVIMIIVIGVAIRARVDQTSKKAGSPLGASTPIASTPIVAATTPPTTSPAVVPTPGATSVAPPGANGPDDTGAFTTAMTAALAGPVRFPVGPSGHSQAVVRVPAGVYRIFQLKFVSNIRMEVDAGAEFREAGTRSVGAAINSGGPSLIIWGPPKGSIPLSNVSIVGVGTAPTTLKQLAVPLEPGWNVNHSFTFNLDASRTKGDNFLSALQLTNVNFFVINNVFTIQNGTPSDPTDPLTGGIGTYPAPTSTRAAIVFRPNNDSPVGGPYNDPHNGSIFNVYNVGGSYGYGPTQITSGHVLKFRNVFSRGGTTLRLETDATLNKKPPFGGELRGVTADNIVGAQCNRAVSFAPHDQQNFDVHVTHVIARNCHQGVIESVSDSGPGAFSTSTLTDVQVVGGDAAQVPLAVQGMWQTGRSIQAFFRDGVATWSVVYSRVSCSGVFVKDSKPINLGGTLRKPICT